MERKEVKRNLKPFLYNDTPVERTDEIEWPNLAESISCREEEQRPNSRLPQTIAA